MKRGETTPLIVAHRGDSHNAPENTVAALRAAVEYGADGVEFDVRLAKDGVPVVIHDATLKRTAGINRKIADLSSAELADIDVGSLFNAKYRKRAKAEFAGERIPTLAVALDLLRGFDGLVCIELKCGRTSLVPLVEAVCAAVGHTPFIARVIIMSFRLAAITEVRQRLPTVQTAALFDPSMMNFIRRRSSIVAIAQRAGARQLSIHRSLATPRLIDAARRANMPVTVWTVDEPRWIDRCRRLGIDALITNHPARMLAARNDDRQDNI